MMSQFEFPAGTAGLSDLLVRRTVNNCESFPALAAHGRKQLNIPNGLVVSANDRIRGTLGEAMLLCGIAPVFAASIADSRQHITTGDLCIVICEDLLPDGSYCELLGLRQQREHKSPVIVVSRTGDWEEYFAAMELGAHDFLAYPLIPGELQRILRELLLDRRRQQRSQAPSHL